MRSAFGDTIIPVIVTTTGAETATPVDITGKDISDANCEPVLVTEPLAIALLAKDAVPPEVAGVNTPDGKFILILWPFAKACEIFIVMVKVLAVHTAELPWDERAPAEGAHKLLAGSHVVPTSQHPGP